VVMSFFETDGPIEKQDVVYLAGEAKRLISDPIYKMACASMRADIYQKFADLPLTTDQDDNRRALAAQLKAVDNLDIYFDFVIRQGKVALEKKKATEAGTRKVV
jgi:hypothetical protein